MAVALIAGLSLPLAQQLTRVFKEEPLYGYTPPSPALPTDLVAAWFDRRFQQWVETTVATKTGFRAALVRTYNETAFRLFHGLPHLDVVAVEPGGLIYRHHVMSLNDSVLLGSEKRKEYERRARRALIVQNVLARLGSHLLMVIAPSKGGAYPDVVPRRFLARDAAELLGDGVQYGAVLERMGVHVIDFGREFRTLRPRLPYRLDAPYGVHWNFYAGCLAARRIVERLHDETGDILTGIDCEPALLETAHSTDIDGLAMLNLWQPDRYLVPLPYPTVRAIERPGAVRPRMLFIGDSFSDQVRQPLSLARVFSEVAFSSYFMTLRRDGPGETLGRTPEQPIDRSAFNLGRDVKPFRFVIVESVDYNISYQDYGFFDEVLKRALIPANPGLVVDCRKREQAAPVLISGWADPGEGGAQVAAWPAELAFQRPAAPGSRRLVVRATMPDGPVDLTVRVNGRALPVTLTPVAVKTASIGPVVAGEGGVELAVELPAELLADDTITTVTLAPETPAGRGAVLLMRLSIE